MKEKTTKQLVVELLTGVVVICIIAEVLLLFGLAMYGGFIHEDYAKYRASVDVFIGLLCVAWASGLVIPLVVAPLMKIIGRSLWRFRPIRIIASGFRAVTDKIGSIRVTKRRVCVISGILTIYVVITIVRSLILIVSMRRLEYQEIQSLMSIFAPKICSLLWQSWAVFAGEVFVLFVLICQYDERVSSSNAGKTEESNENVALQPNS